jgi:hypothetical protein
MNFAHTENNGNFMVVRSFQSNSQYTFLITSPKTFEVSLVVTEDFCWLLIGVLAFILEGELGQINKVKKMSYNIRLL